MVLFVENPEKPQTLFFSATLPDWVQTTAKRYMTKDKHIIDVIGNEKQQTALTVEVGTVEKIEIPFFAYTVRLQALPQDEIFFYFPA